MPAPVRAHRVALVRAKSEVGEWLCGADEGESGPLVLWVVTARVGMVELPFEHADSAGEVPALLARGGELETLSAGGVEDVLLGAAPHGSGRAARQLEQDHVLALGCQPCYGL